jgi:IS30 family transposase
MERKYKSLTLLDRGLIGKLQIQGLNQSEIAQLLGVHKSTNSREFKRNQMPRLGYIVYHAQNLSEQRRALPA